MFQYKNEKKNGKQKYDVNLHILSTKSIKPKVQELNSNSMKNGLSTQGKSKSLKKFTPQSNSMIKNNLYLGQLTLEDYLSNKHDSSMNTLLRNNSQNSKIDYSRMTTSQRFPRIFTFRGSSNSFKKQFGVKPISGNNVRSVNCFISGMKKAMENNNISGIYIYSTLNLIHLNYKH